VHAPAAIQRVTWQHEEVPRHHHDIDLPAASCPQGCVYLLHHSNCTITAQFAHT